MPSPPVRMGYGDTRPAGIDNGGDPGSRIESISWSSWGGPDAYGTGLTYIPQLNYGWYPGTVPAQLHATGLGACGSTSGYRALYVRVPSVPGGPMGAWRLWDGTTDLCHPAPKYWPQVDIRTLPKAPNCPSGYEAYGNPGTASQMCVPPEYIPRTGFSCPGGSAVSLGPVLCFLSSTPANIVVPAYRG